MTWGKAGSSQVNASKADWVKPSVSSRGANAILIDSGLVPSLGEPLLKSYCLLICHMPSNAKSQIYLDFLHFWFSVIGWWPSQIKPSLCLNRTNARQKIMRIFAIKKSAYLLKKFVCRTLCYTDQYLFSWIRKIWLLAGKFKGLDTNSGKKDWKIMLET